jgi:hypothetical protein
VAKIKSIIVINSATPKAAAKLELFVQQTDKDGFE